MSCPLDKDPSFYSCGNPYPECYVSTGLDFIILGNITSRIARCPSDPRLYDASSVTQAACAAMVQSDYTLYSGATVYARIMAWKVQLIQLIAVFPRPPLGWSSQVFTIFHLLGDPIGTIHSLTMKTRSCERRARFWKTRFRKESENLPGDEQQYARYWKRLAIIIDSCDEWGHAVGDEVEAALEIALMLRPDRTIEDRRKFLAACELTAKALAADRATKFLPIGVAISVFITSVVVSFAKIPEETSGSSPNTFVNLEVYGVSFSAIYFWILVPTVISSVIGVSQTEAAIPRILDQFRSNLKRDFEGWGEWDTVLDPNRFSEQAKRKFSGGLYSWTSQEARRRDITSRPSASTHDVGSLPVALLSLTLCAVAAIVLSARVPPLGPNCRAVTELVIFLIWLLSACCGFIPFAQEKREYAFVFAKDFVTAGSTIACVFATVTGVLNRCSCYSLFGLRGVTLPNISWVEDFFAAHLWREYLPIIVVLCIVPQLVITAAIFLMYSPSAWQVFVQTDSDQSNLAFIYEILGGFARLFSRLGNYRRRAGSRPTSLDAADPEANELGTVSPH